MPATSTQRRPQPSPDPQSPRPAAPMTQVNRRADADTLSQRIAEHERAMGVKPILVRTGPRLAY